MTPKIREAQKGQRVSMVDDIDGILVYGSVVEQLPDSVIILWDDIDGNCQHFSDEWNGIALV